MSDETGDKLPLQGDPTSMRDDLMSALFAFGLGVVMHLGVSAYSGLPNAADAGLPYTLSVVVGAVIIGATRARSAKVEVDTLVSGMAFGAGQFVAAIYSIPEVEPFILLGVIAGALQGVLVWGMALGTALLLRRLRH